MRRFIKLMGIMLIIFLISATFANRLLPTLPFFNEGQDYDFVYYIFIFFFFTLLAIFYTEINIRKR